MTLFGLKVSVITDVISAVLPIVAFLFAFQYFVVRKPIENVSHILIGIAISIVGLILFLEGLELGFLPLGRQVGAGLQGTGSAYIVIAFGTVFGYAITLAEPNLRVLIGQVETVSAGSIPGSLVLHTVSAGVGASLGISILRILLGIPIEPEKEIVITLIEKEKTDVVLEAAVRAGKLDEPGRGRAFVMNVEKMVGVVHLEQENTLEAVGQSL